jgi:ribonuclease Y
MFNASLLALVIVVAMVAGVVVGFILKQMLTAKEIKSSKTLMARIAEEAKKEAETIKKEAILQSKENLLKMKAEFDSETKDRRGDFDAREKRIRSKEENLDKRIDGLAQKESSIEGREKLITKKDAAS